LTLEVNQDYLEEVVELISRTVKGDRPLIYRILFNGLSMYLPKPIQLMISDRTAEGKTYPSMQTCQYFPEENVMILGSATPQTFKYEHGILVDGNYNPIQDRVNQLQVQIEITEDKEERKSLKIELRKLLAGSKTLIDLREKWIIFLEPPDPKLLEMLYSTLSGDKEFIEHKLVNQSNGEHRSHTIVLRGTPAMLICTARDDSRLQRWDETMSRFHIISTSTDNQKYNEGMDLIAQEQGLPKELFDEQVISEEEKKRCRFLIRRLIEQIRESEGKVLNPFNKELSRVFPKESGKRFREFKILLSLISVHCLCYSHSRPKVVIKGRRIPIVTKADIMWTVELMREQTVIPPYKMKWFKKIFLPAWEINGDSVDFRQSGASIVRKVITGNEIVQYQFDITEERITVKQVRENYLETLFEHGIIEKEQDPRNKTRDVYWPAEGYLENSHPSLIAISWIDDSCVNAFIEKVLKQRFSFEIHNNRISEDQVIQYILSDQNVI
jgi:hypothetical protein